MKAVVFTLGCKVNYCESLAMIAALNEFGVETSEKLSYADMYILNTCSVTGEADKKSRQAIARAMKFNPNAPIYVCGCSSEYSRAFYENKAGVRLVGGTKDKTEFAKAAYADCVSFLSYEPALRVSVPQYSAIPFMRTRGVVKVQDGCNNFCSYCIIPYLRGRIKSEPIENIVENAARAAEHSSEIVLTGINLSAYGKDSGSSLTELIKALKPISVRKRLGSLECEVVDEDFLHAIEDSGFCSHFHLSMQSGSSTVLKRMNRHYDSDFFIKKVELIRKFFPDAGITTDIIAGFPEESEAEHKETLATVDKIAFSSAHVFPYSQREGTVAAKLKQVPMSVRCERAAEISALVERSAYEFRRDRIGKTYSVCFEDEEADGSFGGYTENYIKVNVRGNGLTGSLKKVIITSVDKNSVKGELI